VEWQQVDKLFREHVVDSIAEWVPEGSQHHAATLEFALGRIEEGKQLAAFFAARGLTGRVLDIGAGNGGVSVGMSNHDGFEVVGLDIVVNRDLLALREGTSLPMEQIVGSGHHLPFADNSFDVVLCLETIEHVPRADLLGPEIVRVLRPGGACMITTPPRLRYWFARDPHYAIPGLILLPDPLQRFVASTLLRRTDTYDVVHIFWHVDEIARLFPGANVDVLWDRNYNGSTIGDKLWYRFRNFLWNRIVLTKR
jgi:SAM-dependent methyltransferase